MSPAGGGRATRPTLGPGWGTGRSLSPSIHPARPPHAPALPHSARPGVGPSGLPARGRLTWPPLLSVRNWYWILWSPNAACWTLAMATAVCSSAPGPSPPVGGQQGRGHAQRARGGPSGVPGLQPRRGPQPPWPPPILTFLQLNALLGLGSLVVAAGGTRGAGPGVSEACTPRPGAGARCLSSRPGPR